MYTVAVLSVYTITIYVMVHLVSSYIFLLPPTTNAIRLKCKCLCILYFYLLWKLFRYYVYGDEKVAGGVWEKWNQERKKAFFYGEKSFLSSICWIWKKGGKKKNWKTYNIVLFLTYLRIKNKDKFLPGNYIINLTYLPSSFARTVIECLFC